MNKFIQFKKASEIILKGKICQDGESLRGGEHWVVAGLPIWYKENKYNCTCKDCSIRVIPNDIKPTCCYVLALQLFKVLEKYG